MKNPILFLIAMIITVFLMSGCAEKKQVMKLSNRLKGTWIKIETKNTYADSTQIIKYPQPCIFIFSDSYYSFATLRGTAEREPYRQPSNPTVEEIINAYNSYSSNTGRYEITDSTITTFPIIAKVPGYSGGKGVYEYSINSDTLYLTMIKEYSRNGEWASWLDHVRSTSKFIKAE